MRFRLNRRGGAYAFVLAAAALMFMLLTAALAVTARGRDASANYARYAGLYDLAASQNERVLSLIQRELDGKHGEFDANARAKILSDNLEEHLIFKNGRFTLAFPENGYYAALYRAYAVEAADAYLRGNFPYTGGKWKGENIITLTFTPADAADSFTDKYNIVTSIERLADRFAISAAVKKSGGGAYGYPVTVGADIIFTQSPPHEEILIPAYKWRDMPEYFGFCLYAGGEIMGGSPAQAAENGIKPSSFINEDALDVLAGRADRHIIILTGDAVYDVAEQYESGAPAPVCVIHIGGTLTLRGGAGADIFAGVAVSRGDIVLDGAGVMGTVIAEGNIELSAAPAVYTPDPDMLFRIETDEPARQALFDSLGLTRFYEADAAPVTDMERLLYRVAFDLDGENGRACELLINNFDAPACSMIEFRKIAD